jgi:hypothetical protein
VGVLGVHEAIRSVTRPEELRQFYLGDEWASACEQDGCIAIMRYVTAAGQHVKARLCKSGRYHAANDERVRSLLQTMRRCYSTGGYATRTGAGALPGRLTVATTRHAKSRLSPPGRHDRVGA